MLDLEENRVCDLKDPDWGEKELKRGRALEAAALAEASKKPMRAAQSRFDKPSTTLADYANRATLDGLLGMLERERHDMCYCRSLSLDEVRAYMIDHDFYPTNETDGGYAPGREHMKAEGGRAKKLQSDENGLQAIRPDHGHTMTREELVAFYSSKNYLTPKLKAEIKRSELKPVPTRRADMVKMLVDGDIGFGEQESDGDMSD
jgi:hypothetical protein